MKLIANIKGIHDYFIEDTYEAGIALAGTEVNPCVWANAASRNPLSVLENGEVYIYGMHISPYEKGNYFQQRPVENP